MAAKSVRNVDDRSFDATTAEGVSLVDFWAPWCGPCRTQGTIIESVAETIGDGAVVAKVNVDEAPNTAARFGVRSIPTLFVMVDGTPFAKYVGVQDESTLVQALESAARG